MKKILCIVMSLLMCLSSLTVVASDVATMDIVVKSAEVNYGDGEATVVIEIPNNPGIAAIGFNVNYNKDAMTLKSAELGKIFTGDLECNINAVPFVFNVYTGSGNRTDSGALVTLVFKLEDGCPAGTYDITIDNVEVLDFDEAEVDYNITNGYVKVKAKSFTGITIKGANYTYDGSAKTLAVSGVPAGATVTYASDDFDADGKAIDAGTYNITATVSKEGYEDWSDIAVLTIKPKAVTLTGVKAVSKTYDGTTDAAISEGTLSGKIEGDDVSAVYPEKGTFAKASVGNDIAVSVPEITLDGADKNNYVLSAQPKSLKANITKAPITVKADDIQIVKGDAVPALTYQITSGKLFGDDKLSGALTTKANGTKVGSFDITQGTLKATSNYSLAFEKGILTVVDKTPQNITVSEITEKTYGDESFKVEVTADEVSQLADFTFESSNTDVAEISADGTVTIKAAGETNITVKQAGNEDYAPFTKTQKLVVNKKDITVTAVNVEEKTAEIEGVFEADMPVGINFDKIVIEKIEEISEGVTKVNVKNLVLTGEKAGNYNLTTESVESSVATENLVTVAVTAENGSVEGAGTYLKGSNATLKAIPDSKYKFKAWKINDEVICQTAEYTFVAESDVELIAEFTKNSSGGLNLGGGGGGVSTYTIKFETNGADNIADASVKSGNTIAAPEAPKKEGYIFKGWYTDKELTKEYDFSAKVNKNITLYAAWESVEMHQIVLTIGKNDAKVFGKDAKNDVAPEIVNDRTMLPIRFIAESLGAEVKWDADARKVTIIKGETEIVIVIDSDTAKVNKNDVKLDSAAYIKNDRTYLPLRFVSENLGAKVEWNENAQQVVITK